MGKRGVINPTYGMTDAAFFNKHRSMLRKQWMYSQMYKDAINRAKIPYLGGGQRKYSIKVECCGTEYKLLERVVIGETKAGKEKTALAYQVDHKIDAGSLKCFSDFSGFVERLNCPPGDLQVWCYFCHKKKTHG